MHSFYRGFFLSGLGILLAADPVQASESTETPAPKTQSGQDLGKVGAKLANPLADLWALSMSFNMPQFYDGDANTGDPEVGASLLFQPIMPIPLHGTGDDQLRLITRPIIPSIFSQPVPKGFNDFDDESGIGDIQLTLLASVPDRIAGNLILGAGPAVGHFVFRTGGIALPGAALRQRHHEVSPRSLTLKRRCGVVK